MTWKSTVVSNGPILQGALKVPITFLEVLSYALTLIISTYTSIQIQNNIVQQKYNIYRTCQILSINIERVGANNRLLMTMTTSIIHKFFVDVQIHNILHKLIQFQSCNFYAPNIYIYIYIYINISVDTTGSHHLVFAMV